MIPLQKTYWQSTGKGWFCFGICFGLAGNESEEDTKIYKEIIFNNVIERYLDRNKIIIGNDTRIGLAAGSDSKNVIMIICGTGSNCFGINEEGKEVKVNGWDFILGVMRAAGMRLV